MRDGHSEGDCMTWWRLVSLALLLALLSGCGKDTRPEIPSARPVAAVQEAIARIGQFEACVSGGGPSNDVQVLDVRGMSAREFKRRLEEMRGRGTEVHLWMPGASDWVLVARPTTNAVSLALAMERFADDQTCVMSIPELFASYVGTLEDVMPAFEAELKGDVLPEWFVTREIPKLGWLDASAVDEDIRKLALREIRSMQVVRREILEGNVLAAKATDRKEESRATDKWSAAWKRNPRDPMLLERMGNLARNARGFLEVGKVLQAMKCYETILLINANDVVALHNFGICLKRLGRTDIATQVLQRAEALSR